jgi:hypothetical protein
VTTPLRRKSEQFGREREEGRERERKRKSG